MKAGPFTRAAGRGCGLALLQLVLVPILLLLVLAVPIAIASVIPAPDEVRLVIGAGGIALAMTALIAGALIFAGLRTRVLDPGFAQIGITGGGWMPNLREYHGALAGRALDGVYARRGGVLELSVDARTASKVAIGSEGVGAAREAIGLAPLPSRADLPGTVISADEPGWADALLSDPGARHAIAYLLQDPSGREIRWVLVRPGCVKVTRRWIDPDAATATIAEHARALAQLAEACERMPPPARAIAPGRLERAFRRAPTRTALLVVAALLAVLIGPLVVIAALMIVAASAGP